MTTRTSHRHLVDDLTRVGASAETLQHRVSDNPGVQRLLGFVEPNSIADSQPVVRAVGEHRIGEGSSYTDGDHRPRRMSAREFLDFLPYPARSLQRAVVNNDDEDLRSAKCRLERAIQLLARRRFVFAEEHREVALAQSPGEVGRVALRAARWRAECERNENVVAEEARRRVTASSRAARDGSIFRGWPQHIQ